MPTIPNSKNEHTEAAKYDWNIAATVKKITNRLMNILAKNLDYV